MANWQLVPEAGEQILQTISYDVERWNANLGAAKLEEEVRSFQGDASLVPDLVMNAADGGYLTDVDRIVEQLGEDEKRAILRAHVGEIGVRTLGDLRHGTVFDVPRYE